MPWGGSANGLQRTAQAEAGKPDSRFARYVTQRCRNVILNIQKPQNSEKYLLSAHTKCMHNYQLGSSGIGLLYSLELLNSARQFVGSELAEKGDLKELIRISLHSC